MIVVYSNNKSNRLIYVLNVVFKYVIGVDYELTTNLEVFKKIDTPKLNYSAKEVENCLQIVPSNILFEKGLKDQNIKVDWLEKVPFFFKIGGVLEYDILASVFWMITRYEEYLPFSPDIHGRFQAENSLAFQQGFLKKPVVNLWIEILKEKLKAVFPELIFPVKKASFLNTLDIDIAYSYRAKGSVRFWGGFLKSLIRRDKEEIKQRVDFLKTKKDPFDTYGFIKKHAKYVKSHYFFLLGNKAKYDGNINHRKEALHRLIQDLSKENEIGIHPSYQSNKRVKKVAIEIKRLEKITGDKATTSRQHFLKLNFPDTYEGLIMEGITKDYTLGFASQIGFRAGICNTYPFYNLITEEERPLWLTPFQVMDGTLNQYLKLSPEQGLEETKILIEEVRKVNGLFVSLWHNSSLSETDVWKGWSKVYKETLTLMR